jgi:O-antigen biosynthesis protein WbqP
MMEVKGNNTTYQRYVKRPLDIMSASIIIVLTLPCTLIIAIIIKLESPGPVFFKHQRAGKDLKPFTVYKFRTMKTNAPKSSPTRHLKDSSRYITRSGRIMRKLSLDELPQLVNVIRGEMSIVGPRPLVLSEKDVFAERAKYGANSCTPGITGWAQVNGRDEVRPAEKAYLDGIYAQSFGPIMDLKCLLLTFSAVLSLKGHREGHELKSSENPQDSTYDVTSYPATGAVSSGELDEGAVV